MKMNRMQRLEALEAVIKKDTSCEWSLKPMRGGEYHQIVDACIEGDMSGLRQLLARHGVKDVEGFRNSMLSVLNDFARNY